MTGVLTLADVRACLWVVDVLANGSVGAGYD